MKESRWRSMSIMDLNLSRRKSSSSSSNNNNQGDDRPPAGATPISSHTGSGPGQSYELIKSTQSLVDRLRLNAEDIAIQPVHPSIIGQDTWFQITYMSSGATRYFSCQSPRERDEWIRSLRTTLALAGERRQQERRRTDNSLKISVLEVKGLRDRKRYYVEILVDDKLYARTSSKKMNGMCFWGEHFEFRDLPRTDRISLLIHKDKGNNHGNNNLGNSNSSASSSNLVASHLKRRRKKAKKPVGRVRISIPSVQSRYMQEKWHAVEKSSRRESPSIRLKCQYQSVDVLPLREYEPLVYFLKDEYRAVVKMLEPAMPVRMKEELASEMVRVFHGEDVAEDVLAELVADEVSGVDNVHLAFRGNSVATKAMEAYLKLIGKKYLQATLQPVVQEIVSSEEVDLEVDPVKVNDPAALQQHRANLRTVVKQVWSRVAGSHSYFPPQLQRCFHKIRQYLEHVGRPEVGDNLVSSCIFLRYLCPAILSPSLFGLCDGFPGERANRNLTLVAKTIQSLANFTRYEGKENAMEFLNTFLEEERAPMRAFLRQISSPVPEEHWMPDLTTSNVDQKMELGRHLSCLHTILFENISKVNEEQNPAAKKLKVILDEINQLLHRPTIPELEQISQPTLTTLRQIQDAESATLASSSSSSSSKFSWWTLPKKSKNGNGYSHPAPHHEAAPRSHFLPTPSFAKPEPAVIASSLDSSSNEAGSTSGSTGDAPPSLSPSPSSPHTRRQQQNVTSIGVGASSTASTLGRWSNRGNSHSTIAINQTGDSQTDNKPKNKSRRAGDFASSLSLDTEESSDDSTYSSQCQSDANSTPRCASASQTLPRPLTGAAHGYSTHTRHRSVQRGSHVSSLSPGHHYRLSHSHLATSPAKDDDQEGNSRTLGDYEREILELRSAMETLQIKLGEAERKLEERGSKNRKNTSGVGRRREMSTSDDDVDDEEEERVKEAVNRLSAEEERLRRDQVASLTGDADRERMIAMQQRKVSSLDAASGRLLEELGRLGNKGSSHVSVGNQSSVNVVESGAVRVVVPSQHQNLQQDQDQESGAGPKTVDELLDSLHSTPI